MNIRKLLDSFGRRDSALPKPQTSVDERALVPTLLGVAVDVSGSMRESIRNAGAADLSRFDGVGRGFDALLADSRRLAQTCGGQAMLPLRVFSYAFGLSLDPGYADLLGILTLAGSLADNQDFQAYLEQVKNNRRQEAERKGEAMRRQASQFSGLASLARSRGFGSVVDSYTKVTEDDVRRRLTLEAEEGVRQDVVTYLRKHIPDTTLSVDDLTALWGRGGGTFQGAGQFMYGSTPMCSCLREVVLRFKREKVAGAGSNEKRLLLLISDGEPTDGDPGELGEELRKSGIHVACVFVTNRDVRAPRNLPGRPEDNWPKGANLLFDMATPVECAASGLLDAKTDWRTILENSGWTVSPGARLFIQANHSETLADFMRVVATAFPAKGVLQALRQTIETK